MGAARSLGCAGWVSARGARACVRACSVDGGAAGGFGVICSGCVEVHVQSCVGISLLAMSGCRNDSLLQELGLMPRLFQSFFDTFRLLSLPTDLARGLHPFTDSPLHRLPAAFARHRVCDAAALGAWLLPCGSTSWELHRDHTGAGEKQGPT